MKNGIQATGSKKAYMEEASQKRGWTAARLPLTAALSLLVMLVPGLAMAESGDGRLEIRATVPELGMLAKEVGGNRVNVESFARGTEDPHFIDARPNFIRSLNQADVFIQIGMEMEIGWVPVLLKQARNPRLNPGSPNFIDASSVITPRNRPTTDVDRSMGDVHPQGSPHYLTDPSAGLLVAGLIRDRLKRIDPTYAAYYEARYNQFAKQLCLRLFGADLTNQYSGKLDRLALLLHRSGYDGFLAFLRKNGLESKLGGWLQQVQSLQSRKYVGDHAATWSYMAHVFGLTFVGYMEPVAGVDPTTNHLTALASRMQSSSAMYILSASYYNPRYARFLAEKTGAAILPMANQGEARPGTDNYLDFIGYNVSVLTGGAR